MWTCKLFSATVRPGHSRVINSSLLTRAPPAVASTQRCRVRGPRALLARHRAGDDAVADTTGSDRSRPPRENPKAASICFQFQNLKQLAQRPQDHRYLKSMPHGQRRVILAITLAEDRAFARGADAPSFRGIGAEKHYLVTLLSFARATAQDGAMFDGVLVDFSSRRSDEPLADRTFPWRFAALLLCLATISVVAAMLCPDVFGAPLEQF